MISGHETCSIYNSLKLHFSRENYDSIKYKFHTKINVDSYNKRRDKYLFEKTALKYKTKRKIAEFCVSNFITDKTYIAEFSEDCLIDYYRKISHLKNIIKEDFKKIGEKENRSLKHFLETQVMDSIIGMYLSEEISLETFAIFNKVLNFIPNVKKKLNDPLGIYTKTYHKAFKYSPFVTSDKEEMRKLILNNLKIFEFGP